MRLKFAREFQRKPTQIRSHKVLLVVVFGVVFRGIQCQTNIVVLAI